MNAMVIDGAEDNKKKQADPWAVVSTGDPVSSDPWAVVDSKPDATQTAINARAAAARNPLAVSEADTLAKRHGVPVDTAERNMTALKAKSAAEDALELPKTHPGVASWLGLDPNNAAVAALDWASLKAIETVFKATPIGATAIGIRPLRGVAGGGLNTVGGAIQGIGEAPGIALRTQARMGSQVLGLFSSDLQKQYDDNMDSYFGSNLDVSNWAKSAGDFLGGGVNSAGEALVVNQDDHTFADTVAEGFGSFAAGAGLSYINPVLGAGLWAGSGVDQQRQAVEDAGMYGTAQGDAAMTVGSLITAVTERVGLSWAMRYLPKGMVNSLTTRVGDLLKAGFGEGSQEVAEQLSHNLTDKLLINPNQSMGDGVWDNGAAGFAVGLLVRGGQHVQHLQRDANDAVQENQALNTLVSITEKSSLFKQSPERFKDALGKLKSDGMEDVYVPVESWQTLFQSSPDEADNARKAAGVTDADYASALTSGGRIRVPVEGFLTGLTLEQQQALAKDGRFKSDGFVPPDAEAFDPDATMMDYMKQAGIGRRAGKDTDVYNEFVDRLTGAYSKADAEYLAEFPASFMTGYGSRSGFGAELADKLINDLTVVAESRVPERLQKVLKGRKDVVPEVDSMLDAVRAGAYPSDSQVFGPTLSEWVRSAGGIDPDSVGADWLKMQDANRVGLLRAGGMAVEDALRNAVELGYINKQDINSLDVYSDNVAELNDLIDALTQDMSGVKPVYSYANLNNKLQDFSVSMESLSDELRDRGIDLANVSNVEARRLMGMATRDVVSGGGQELAQGSTQTRASVIARAGELGLPKIGKTADIVELIRVAEKNPREWSREEFDTILPYLQVHQDFRDASIDPNAAQDIMANGLKSGMSDSLYDMITGRHPTFGRSLRAGNAFVFTNGSIKTLSKDNPRFAPGNKPLFMFSSTDGQDPYEAITQTAVQNPAVVAPTDSRILNQSTVSEDTLTNQDSRWYYSAVSQAVSSSKTEKASGDQWLATLRNTPGVKSEEIEWLGLPEFLAGRKGVTRSAIEEYIRTHEVVVEETVMGGVRPRGIGDVDIQAHVALLRDRGFEVVENPDDMSMVLFREVAGDEFELLSPEELGDINAEVAAQRISEYLGERVHSESAPYSNMTLPGGKNYRVMLLRFPDRTVHGLTDAQIKNVNEMLTDDGYSELDEDQIQTLRDGGLDAHEMLEDMSNRIVGISDSFLRKVKSGDNFTHSHFPGESNFFAHARFEERTDEAGNRVLFILELQSDWHNRGSRLGYKGRKPSSVYPSLEVMQKATNTNYSEVTESKAREFNVKGDLADYVLITFSDGSEMIHNKQQAYEGLKSDYKYWASNRVSAGDKQGLSDAEWTALELFVRNEQTDLMDQHSSIPDAPFKKSWYDVMIKRMVRYAAENGYHSVALPRPEQITEIENWGVPHANIKADPNHKYASIVGRYEEEYVRTIKALAKKYGGEFTGSGIFPGDDVKFDNFEELFDLNVLKIATKSGMSPSEALRLGDQAIKSLDDMRADEVGFTSTMFEFMEWFPDQLMDSDDVATERRGEIYADAFRATVTSPGFVQVPRDVQDTFEIVFERMLASEVGRLEVGGAYADRGTMSAGEIMTTMREHMADMGEGPNGENLTIRNFADSFADMVGDRDEPGDAFMSSAVERAIIETDKHPLTRSSLPTGNKNPSIVITPRLHLASMSGLPLFQRNTRDEKRGSLSILEDGTWVMNLLKARDWSTFLHESAHVQLEMMRWVDVKLREADPATLTPDQVQVLADHDYILKWMGVASFADIKTEHHEQFAETYEAYLREGKAPAPRLESTFKKFSGWLKAIYKSLSKLPNAKLDDSIRAVMDRMLATDAEIEMAQQSQALTGDLLNVEGYNLTPEERLRLDEAARLSRETAFDQEFQRQYQYEKRQAQEWYRTEKSRVRAQVVDETNNDLTYQAISFMRRGTMPDGSPIPADTPQMQMNSTTLIEEYGLPFVQKNLAFMFSKEGVSPDLIAPLFGFDSGRAMIEAISNQRPYGQHVEAETARRMEELHPDPAGQGQTDRANAAVNNEYSDRLLMEEIRRTEALASRAGRPTQYAVMLSAVKRMIGQTRIKDLTPSKHRDSERRLGRAALDAGMKGDFDEVLKLKRQQLMASLMHRESIKAREESEKQLKYAQRLAKKPAQERIAKAAGDYLDQINAILGVYEFRRVSDKELQRRARLSKWVEDRQTEGDVTAVSEALLARVEAQAAKNWREATVQEMADAYEALKNISHLVSLKNRLLKARRAADIEQAVDEMVARAEETLPSVAVDVVNEADLTAVQRAKRKVLKAIDELTRPETLIEILDGGKTGPFHDFLWFAQEQAEASKNKLRRSIADQLKALHSSLPAEFFTGLNESVVVEGITMSRYVMLSTVLNLGTEIGQQRVRDGGITTETGKSLRLNQSQIEKLASSLTSSEIAYVNGLWAVAGSMRGDMEALNVRMSGLPMNFVTAAPMTVTSADGVDVVLTGGYWPLAYDRDRSSVGERQSSDTALQIMMGMGISRAVTSKGYTKERVIEFSSPLLLNLGQVLQKNLEEVMTDLSYREAVRDINSLMTNQRLKTTIISRLGRAAYDSLNGGLAYSVSASADAVGMSARSHRQMTDWVMSNMSVSALGIRPDIALGNYMSAIIQGMTRVQTRAMFRGLRELWLNRGDMTQQIKGLSQFMADRLDDLDHHYSRELLKTKNETGYRAAYFRVMMTLHRMADHDVTRAVWWGSYSQSRADGMDQAEAVRAADSVIRMTQTASGRKDLATYERDPSFKQMRMFMGPMFVIFGSVRNTAGGSGVASSGPGARLALGLNVLLFAPAMFALAAGRWPDDDDDEIGVGDWALWVATNTGLMFAMQTVPLVREVAGAIEAAVNDKPVNPRAAPTAQAVASLVKSTKSLWQQGQDYADGEDVNYTKLTIDLATVGGTVSGFPASQTRRSAKAIEWINENPDATAAEIARVSLYGPPKN